MSEEGTRDAAKGLRYLSILDEEGEHSKTETCRHRKPGVVESQVMMKGDYDVQLEDDPMKQLAATADAMASTRYQEMIRQSRRTTQSSAASSISYTQTAGRYSHHMDSELRYRTLTDSLWSMCARFTSKQLDRVKVVDYFSEEFTNCLANLKQGISVGMLTGLDIIPCTLKLTMNMTASTLAPMIGDNNSEENAKQKQLMLTVSSTGEDLPDISKTTALPVLFEVFITYSNFRTATTKLFVGAPFSCNDVTTSKMTCDCCRFVEDDDAGLVGPLIAGSDSDLVTLVFGLASISSAMARNRNSFLLALDEDRGDLLWQAARACMWLMSHEVGCRAAVEAVEKWMCALCKVYNVKKPNLIICCTSGSNSSSVMSE